MIFGMQRHLVLFVCVIAVSAGAASAAEPVYPWLDGREPADRLVDRFAPPTGYVRVPAGDGSFARWLRTLPLHEGRPAVRYYNGKPKKRDVHAAVVDLDVGNRDLQQCADAVMRLRAEWLYSRKRYGDAAFNFTSGDRCAFAKWSEGWRPKIRGNKVDWVRTGKRGTGYDNFRGWMQTVFIYAGTASLERELDRIKPRAVEPGDVWIKGGHPGHAVLVLDVAEHPDSGKRVFMIGQSYMPAQDFHVLVNPAAPKRGVWYDAAITDRLRTPEWTFTKDQLRRFR